MSDAGADPGETKAHRRELDRVGAFSDGVFAVAITLLVLNIEVPASEEDDLSGALWDLLPSLQAYFIAFAVIGTFWYGHHMAWSRLERSSGKLVATNMLLLSLIGLMPFTTALLGVFDEPLATAIYAFNVGLAALADSLIDRVVISDRLAAPVDVKTQRAQMIVGWLRPAIFFLSIPVAWASILLAQLMWLLLIPAPRLATRLA